MYGEDPVVLFGNRDHALQSVQGQRNGLFADHVLTGGKRSDNDLFMHIVRNGDRDHINGGIGEKLLTCVVHLDTAGGSQLSLCGINIVNTGKITYVAVLQMLDMETAAHAAVTDNRSVFLHKYISPVSPYAQHESTCRGKNPVRCLSVECRQSLALVRGKSRKSDGQTPPLL